MQFFLLDGFDFESKCASFLFHMCKCLSLLAFCVNVCIHIITPKTASMLDCTFSRNLSGSLTSRRTLLLSLLSNSPCLSAICLIPVIVGIMACAC